MGRGKKRKLCVSSNPPPLPRPRIDRSKIVLKETGWISDSAIQFHKKFENIEERLKKIDSCASLVGPFRKLKKETDVDGIELIMLDREITDLPEMQTFLKCRYGRYAFWRDSPSEGNPMVVFVDLKTVPEVRMVGCKVEHALLDLCDKSSMFGINMMSAKNAKNVLFDNECSISIAKEEKEAKEAVRKRKASSIGGILGSGLVPSSWNEGETRAWTQDPADIEQLLRSLRLVGIKEEEDRVGIVISYMYSEAMDLVGEGLYGNALELGYLLFLANQETVFEPMCLILHTVYTKLGHHDFLEVLKLTLEQREYSL